MTTLYGILHIPSGKLVSHYDQASHDEMEGTDIFTHLEVGYSGIPWLTTSPTLPKELLEADTWFIYHTKSFKTANEAGELKPVQVTLSYA